MNPSIQEIKTKILKLKAGLAKKRTLQKKREELEVFLADAQRNSEQALLKAHQKEIAELHKKAKDYEILSKELFHKLTLLDREIDLWEEAEEEDVEHLQNELANAILKTHPDQKEIFDAFKNNQRKWQTLETQNKRIQMLLTNLEHLIDTIHEARKRVKRQGLFSYIFGSSPNLMIAKCMQGILTVLAEEKKAVLASNHDFKDTEMQKTMQELYEYTLDLEKDCQKRWGYKQLDQVIEKNYLKIQEFKTRFNQIQNKLTNRSEEINKELQDWLYRF